MRKSVNLMQELCNPAGTRREHLGFCYTEIPADDPAGRPEREVPVEVPVAGLVDPRSREKRVIGAGRSLIGECSRAVVGKNAER